MITEECLVFCKPCGFSSEYLYLKMVLREEDKLDRKFISSILACMREIDHLKRKPQTQFKVCICYLLEGKWIELVKSSDLEDWLHKPSEDLTLGEMREKFDESECVVHELHPKEEKGDIYQDSEEEFSKLKDILYHYVDTFGKKYKNNYFVDLQKQCNTSYNIVYLINTLNVIVFEMTKVMRKVGELTPMYNQIESASWTSFSKHSKQMEADRKDIMLTGDSRMLLLDIVLLKDVKKHVNEAYREEVKSIIEENKKTYLETCVKVVKVSNELKKECKYIYKYDCKTVDSFSKIVTIIPD